MAQLILITGGARSGKSSFAEKLTIEINDKFKEKKQIAYIATSEIMDKEFEERIKIHKERRNNYFKTHEESLEIFELIKLKIEHHDVFLVECLTTWLGNVFYKKYEDKEKFIEMSYSLLQDLLQNTDKTFVFVTNEVGLGIVPDNELSRKFRDMQGRLNNSFASIASSVYFIISGISLKIK